MTWMEKEMASTALFSVGIAIGLFAAFMGPSILYVVATAMIMSGLGSYIYVAELGDIIYTDEYVCDGCEDSVVEPGAGGEWDCVVCGGRMERVSKLNNIKQLDN